MDGDDRCDKERFAIEINVLEKEPEIAIVSTDMEFFDESGVWGKISHPEYPVPEDFVKESPFCHAPCMVKREAYMKVKGYSVSDKLLRVEDYNLWKSKHIIPLFQSKCFYCQSFHIILIQSIRCRKIL